MRVLLLEGFRTSIGSCRWFFRAGILNANLCGRNANSGGRDAHSCGRDANLERL